MFPNEDREYLELQLETVTTCSAKCHFCVYPSVSVFRAGKLMDMGLFKKLIDEAVGIPQIESFVLHGLGEPMLDRYLIDRIRYIRERSKHNIEVYTHGIHMSPEKFDAMKGAGLSTLVVSLNAVNQEQHQKIMGVSGKFGVASNNAQYAIDHSDGMCVQVHAVVNGDYFTQDDMLEFYKRWGHVQRGGSGLVVQEGNWADDNRTIRPFDGNAKCPRALRQIYVMATGEVTTCCFDPTGKQVFGNLNNQTIREVYNSPEYVAFRGAHDIHQAGKYSICRDCTRI